VAGTCLGFEAIVNIIAKMDVLNECMAENVSMALEVTSLAAGSRMLGSVVTGPLRGLTILLQHVTEGRLRVADDSGDHDEQPHSLRGSLSLRRSVLPGDCDQQQLFCAVNTRLRDFFDVLSTNKDLKGVPFVSTIESKKYPIYATQWHPEKNALSAALVTTRVAGEIPAHQNLAQESVARRLDAKRQPHARPLPLRSTLPPCPVSGSARRAWITRRRRSAQ